jgi:hypothetical protein
MLCNTKRKGEALHTVNTRPIAVNTGNGQNRELYLPSGQNYPQDVKEIPVSRTVRPTLRCSYQYGRYIRNAFIKLNLFQSGSRRELVTLFNPKFFSQKLTFQKEMTTGRGGGGGSEENV